MPERKYSKEGLAIFTKKGKLKWGFNSHSQFAIWACYHIVKTDENKVLFFGFGYFPVCELNIDFLTVEEIVIPIDYFVDSVSCQDKKIYWKNSNSIFCFDREKNDLKLVREFAKKDRRMLLRDYLVAIDKDGYTLEKVGELI